MCELTLLPADQESCNVVFTPVAKFAGEGLVALVGGLGGMVAKLHTSPVVVPALLISSMRQ